MPTITTKDGVDLHVRDWGKGRPIVLIHGWPLDGDMWEYQSRPLAEQGFRVVAYDRRGFGRSAQPFSGYDYDTMADDLAGVIEGLNLSGVTLVGFSMGGGEVARYLTRHGAGRVARAALVASVVPFLLKTADNPDGVDRSTFDGMIDGLKADRPHFLAGFAKQFYGAGFLNFSISSELLDWTRSVAMRASPKATLDCVRAFSETDFRPDLKSFSVPTLVIHGSSDATVPIAISGEKAAKEIAGARLKTYSGAPHGLFVSHKDELAVDLAAFANGETIGVV